MLSAELYICHLYKTLFPEGLEIIKKDVEGVYKPEGKKLK